MYRVDNFVWRWDQGKRIDNFSALAEAGIKRVVNLTTGTGEFFHEYDYENPNHRHGIQVINLKWSNFFPPTRSQAVHVMVLLGEEVPTLVHCHSNVDRTGAAILFHLIYTHGWSFKDAYKDFVKKGRHWWFFWWKPFLRKASR